MLSALKSAASGLLAQKHNLDVIANNIANINTTGYKKSRVNFADAEYERVSPTLIGSNEPLAEFVAGTGVSFAAPQVLFSQGSLQETGNLWDLAVAGSGFFQVALPDGRKAYTRDGSFHVDAQGIVTTFEGFPLEPPITIPLDAQSLQIDENGVVWGEVDGQASELGRISVAMFPSPEQLMAVGHNLYLPSDAAGDALIGGPGSGGRGQVVSGVLETSNVELAEEMTKILEAQRAYQLSMRALQTVDEMLGMANNLRR